MSLEVRLMALGALVLLAGCAPAEQPPVSTGAPRSAAESGPVVVSVSDEPISAEQELGAEYEGRLELVGISIPAQVQRGEPFELQQVWHCLETPQRDWWMALHFDHFDPYWRLNRDHKPPVPTSQWKEEQYICWKMTIVFPPEAPLGDYVINIHPYEIVSKAERKQMIGAELTFEPETASGRVGLVER